MNERIGKIVDQLRRIIIGKEEEIKLALCSIFADGHILLEDLPGTGKTTLAIALSRVLGCSFSRIQFTADLLPSDILGGMVYHPVKGEFYFRPGPIFNNIILADEINRATPKTQSALLEAMEERQVTIEGETRPLPMPFLVIATQNPSEIHGTFPLPESQLDRFLIRLQLGYPSFSEEIEIIKEGNIQEKARSIPSALSPEEVIKIQKIVEKVRIHEDLMNYMVMVVQKSREGRLFQYGLSTRALQGWIRISKAYAFIQGRNYVIPEDLKRTFYPISFHRLVPKDFVDINERSHIIGSFLDQFELPQ